MQTLLDLKRLFGCAHVAKFGAPRVSGVEKKSAFAITHSRFCLKILWAWNMDRIESLSRRRTRKTGCEGFALLRKKERKKTKSEQPLARITLGPRGDLWPVGAWLPEYSGTINHKIAGRNTREKYETAMSLLVSSPSASCRTPDVFDLRTRNGRRILDRFVTAVVNCRFDGTRRLWPAVSFSTLCVDENDGLLFVFCWKTNSGNTIIQFKRNTEDNQFVVVQLDAIRM